MGIGKSVSDEQWLGSSDRFGYSWEHFSTLTPEQEEQFIRWTAVLGPDQPWHGKRFLDVGCGAGRNSYWAMKHGAVSGCAMDIAETSLEAARRNLAVYPTVDVVFRSVFSLESGDYDIVFSIGVIHHLDNPLEAIRCMVKAAKPGGKVLIWVYGYENMRFMARVINPLRKLLFSRLPVGLVRWLAFPPAAVLWLLLRLGFGQVDYLKLLRKFSFIHLHHIVFDQMLPRISNYWRRDEVEALMLESGLCDIRLEWVNQVSWSAVGTVPETLPN
ncbi:MAG: class I SAM-dependent methyltransferase [Magnetococcales bacterium]|nr:class I SAM-dependent methyltransferase [Magnetococcales bacterium]NGZ26783.1 class I SAM-dependent methyltransferase [Magnetococcales bacterium]